MKHLHATFFFIFLISQLSVLSQSNLDKIKVKSDSLNYYQRIAERIKLDIEGMKLDQLRSDLSSIGLPKTDPTEGVIHHKAMKLVYSEKHEQPTWVAHIITPDIRNGVQGRSNDFRLDPKVTTGTATETDYFLKTMLPDSTFSYDGFGYDRGHLAPSADFRWSADALSESFYYSNMSPMLADFNRDS